MGWKSGLSRALTTEDLPLKSAHFGKLNVVSLFVSVRIVS